MKQLCWMINKIDECSQKTDQRSDQKGSERSSEKGNEKRDNKGNEKSGHKGNEKSNQKGNERSGQKRSGTKETDPPFFLTPTFQALTVGVPFCIFKFLFGLLALRSAGEGGPEALFLFGWAIIIWAGIDLFMNLARIVFHLAGRESPIEYCTIAQAGRLIGRPKLFLAIDTLISFSIICFVLWSGWIANLGQMEAYLWYAATTMNLISVSLVSIWTELYR